MQAKLKRLSKSIFSVLIFVLLIACKKDEPVSPEPIPPCDTTFIENFSFDTIFPSNYLMSYPGSWWEYSNGSVDSCLAWKTVEIYQTNSVKNCVTVKIDKQILPNYNHFKDGNNAFVSNESSLYPNSVFSTTVSKQIITELDSSICFSDEIPIVGGKVYVHYQNIGHYDSLEVEGVMYYDVLEMKQNYYTYQYHVFGGPTNTYYYFYAKDIGLIRSIKHHQSGLIDTTNLVGYHIEPY